MAFKSQKQIDAEKDELIRAMTKELKAKTEALQRICNTYDNVEDMAGQVSREVLDKFR